jgi:hypothetical protein
MAEAKIYQPSKSAMQSGKAKTKNWILEFVPAEAKNPDPIMGWSGSGDMHSQLKLKFSTQDEAENYAKRQGLSYHVVMPHAAKLHIKTYSDNFKF